jgi:hypothetical protein
MVIRVDVMIIVLIMMIVVQLSGEFLAVILGIEFGGPKPLFLCRMLGFFAQQCVAIRLWDLIIIRVDLAEGKEAVAVPAIIDERRLQRRFDPGYLGEIDIAFELLVLGGFKVEFFNPVALDDGNPGFLRVARVD